MSVLPYSVYRGPDIALIVSGVGKVKSAMAAVYLHSACSAGHSDVLINIGFCGAGSRQYEPGSLLAACKITDMDTGRDYYPDIFFGNQLPRIPLFCYSKPVKTDDLQNKTGFFCDMESAGIMEASKKLSYSHNVLVLKIISDYLMPDNLGKKLLKSYIKSNMPVLESITEEMKCLNDSFKGLSLEEEKDSIDTLAASLRFSEAMRLILLKEVKKARINGREPLKTLKSFYGLNSYSKAEGKKIFEQIIFDIRKSV
ncbi:MAG TPA: nucleoside phosphorylase [Ruminiclostridium sp.]|nr:nucleoside phosphorylase [Ruminiclostridium sp.]